MYIPEPFILSDPAATADLLRDHPFGLLVTADPGAAPVATHLPFLFDADAGPHGTLSGHMARANPQWRDFAALEAAGGEALAVFQGPHGYVSPRWYGPGDAVPTWNYLAVHAYGLPRVIEDATRVRALQEDLVAIFEAGAAAPWSMVGQDGRYIARMLRGIVAFEIPVARLEAKAKLSQNRTAGDRAGVAAELEASGLPGDLELAAAMRRRFRSD
ncbi:MAG: FMN-binding negative transcriptional regulator [Rhodospirillales bacterium]|nr:FMN-binding negative transcriptional regulator [Rhodospirillales bacterium]